MSKYRIFPIIVLFSMGCLLFNSGQNDQRVEKILSKLEKKYNEAETVSCSFIQSKRIIQLEGTIVTSGELYFKKPHYLRMEHKGDENLVIYCNGEKVWLEDLDLDEVEVFEFSQMGAERRLSRFFPPVFTDSSRELMDYFSVRLAENTGETSRLELVPKPNSDYSFSSLEFEVGSLSRILWLRISYANGDRTEMKFRNWKSHQEISDYFFEYMKKSTKNVVHLSALFR